MYQLWNGPEDKIEAPTAYNMIYIAIATNEHTNPATAIPFPAFLPANETPPRITEIIPQGKQTNGIQNNTKAIIPKTIEAIDNPFDSVCGTLLF